MNASGFINGLSSMFVVFNIKALAFVWSFPTIFSALTKYSPISVGRASSIFNDATNVFRS